MGLGKATWRSCRMRRMARSRGDGISGKGYGMSKTQKTENVFRVWRTADGKFDLHVGCVYLSHDDYSHILLCISYSCPSQCLEGKIGMFLISATNIICFYILCCFASVPFLTQCLPPAGPWASLFHLTLPFFLWEAFHDPRSILCSFLKSKVFNMVYKVLCDLAPASSQTSPCDRPPPPSVLWYIGLLLIPWERKWNRLPPLSSTLHVLFFTRELSCTVLPDRMTKEGLWNEVRFEQSKGTSHVAIWTKNVPNRRMAQKP